MYPSKWEGSETALAGVAIFQVEGTEYRFYINTCEYQKISAMLDAAYLSGREFGANAVLNAAVGAAQKRAADFHI